MLLNRFKKNSTTLLGLDITPTTVQLLELRQTADSYQVETFALETIDKNTMHDQSNNQQKSLFQQEAAHLRNILLNLLHHSGTQLRSAAIALAEREIISKIMPFDVSCSADEIEQFISEDIKKSFPRSKQSIQYDYQIIGPSPQFPDCNNVLYAATEPQQMKTRVAALQKSGITIKVVDIESLAITRACRLIPRILSYLENQHLVAVAHFQDTLCTFIVLQNTAPIFTRTLSVAQTANNELMEMATHNYHGAYTTSQQSQPQQATLLQLIEQALHAFNTTFTPLPIHHLLLCGSAHNLVALAALITAKFNLGCSVANPFSHLSFAERCEKELLLQHAPQFMVCCGLAMRMCD